MRILYCNKYNFPFSGTEMYLFELMELMRAQGHAACALGNVIDFFGHAVPVQRRLHTRRDDGFGKTLCAVAVLRGKKVEAVAVCMLHSYANPAHERRARELVREIWPEAYLCTSSDVLPEFREFERFATTVVNASLMPIMDRYLERFERGVADLGIKVAPRVMQSNGGAVTPGAE